MTNIEEFVKEWNEAHGEDYRSCIFTLCVTDGTWYPLNARVDYSPYEFRRLLTSVNWEILQREIELRSNSIMCISTSRRLFSKGIIEIAIAYRNPDYSEDSVIRTLQWLGEEFFING